MGWKEEQEAKEKIHQVFRTLRKQAPLTLKQEKFCTEGCVRRFLQAKGDNVKKAAKQLRSCLAWRDSIGTDHLIADEFATEISEGAAYVAGIDDESRPVVVFRLKQDFHKIHHHRKYIRLLVFTMEVTMAYMPRNVEQFVLLFDAGCFKSASTCLNTITTTLSVLTDYYPGRMARAFIVDPPSLFSYLWKGVRPFLDSSTPTSVLSSVDIDPVDDSENNSFSFPRTASLRYESSPRVGSSFRFSFNVQPSDSLKPWHLTRGDSDVRNPSLGKISGKQPWPPSRPGAEHKFDPGLSPAIVSPLSVRSLSFASPAARSSSTPKGGPTPDRRSLPSTPWNGRKATGSSPFAGVSSIFRREVGGGRSERCADAFRQWARFYRAPYDEISYRAKMRPPLGGLISIVSPHFRHRPGTVKKERNLH